MHKEGHQNGILSQPNGTQRHCRSDWSQWKGDEMRDRAMEDARIYAPDGSKRKKKTLVPLLGPIWALAWRQGLLKIEPFGTNMRPEPRKRHPRKALWNTLNFQRKLHRKCDALENGNIGFLYVFPIESCLRLFLDKSENRIGNGCKNGTQDPLNTWNLPTNGTQDLQNRNKDRQNGLRSQKMEAGR